MSNALDYRRFADLVSEVQDIVSDDSTTTTRMIKDALNRRYAEISRDAEFNELLATEETGLRRTSTGTVAAFVSGDPFFPLPWNCTRVKSLHFQADTFDNKIDLVDATELFTRAGSQLLTTGLPCYASIVGETAQYQQVSAAELVTVATTTTANDNSQTLRVNYQRSFNYPGVYNWQDLTGLFSAGVALQEQVATGYPIKEICIPEGWVGGLTATGVTSATEIVAIRNLELPATNVNETYQVAKRLLYRLWPVPDQDYLVTTVYWQRPNRLTEDGDTPLIPVSGWLVEMAAGDILRSQEKAGLAREHSAAAAQLVRAVLASDKQAQRTVIVPYMGNFVTGNGYGSWRGGSGSYGY